MATLTVTNDFSAGTTAVAAEVNQNFTDIETFINSTPGVVQADIVDAKGDLVVASGADALARVAVGANGTFLVADSSAANGVAWVALSVDDNIIANQVFS